MLDDDTPTPRILLTGATGYVGGRLQSRFEDRGIPIRCLSRRPAELAGRLGPDSEAFYGDVLEEDSLEAALTGIDTAYYLIHSMGTTDDFAEQDREGARNFAEAASRAGVKRIVYLGGLGTPDPQMSKHLRSRQEVGDVLRQGSANVVEFRASIIIGSGSLSFELIRALVERLPVMITPRWVGTLAQPIAVEDVLDYLMAALDLETDQSQIFEIGGPDRVSYGEIMRQYAKIRELFRLMIPVPVLTPRLSSLWLGLVTPVYARIGRKLVDGLRNPTLVSSNLAEKWFDIRPMGVVKAIERALVNEDREFAQTRWSDALSSSGPQRSWGGTRFGSRLVDSRTIEVDVPAGAAFAPIRRIGGDTGWYYGGWLWKVRGWMDLLVGGIGIRRGRRDPEHVRAGDALDFWRVEHVEPDRLLRLRAEMKVPGRAWLEFEVTEKDGRSQIRQTALFDPVGLFGIAYWYAIWPLHQFVFAGMLRGIARAAENVEPPPSIPDEGERAEGERPATVVANGAPP